MDTHTKHTHTHTHTMSNDSVGKPFSLPLLCVCVYASTFIFERMSHIRSKFAKKSVMHGSTHTQHTHTHKTHTHNNSYLSLTYSPLSDLSLEFFRKGEYQHQHTHTY
eukprot:GHVR01046229.1.p1 GENE.GHVR01046229.1~~GHVR01046229.1.p1  ORF type:complete len:107 (-),score=60.73 GHVR01046229.1:103-423(-)